MNFVREVLCKPRTGQASLDKIDLLRYKRTAASGLYLRLDFKGQERKFLAFSISVLLFIYLIFEWLEKFQQSLNFFNNLDLHLIPHLRNIPMKW